MLKGEVVPLVVAGLGKDALEGVRVSGRGYGCGWSVVGVAGSDGGFTMTTTGGGSSTPSAVLRAAN